MAGAKYPIEMVNGVPVVAAPAEIDASNADWLRAVLLEAARRGHGTLVVDMTGTRFCGSSGLGALVRAHKQALAEGGELRLVNPGSAAVLRVLAITAFGRVIPSFPGLDHALGRAPAATSRPRRPKARARTRAAGPTPEPGASASTA